MQTNLTIVRDSLAILRRSLLGASALIGAATLALPATAQDEFEEDAFEEFEEDRVGDFEVVTVTSKRVEQTIYEAPVAVTAFSGRDLEQRQVIDLVDVGKFVPNLNVTTFSAGNTSSANPFIRGIGIQDHLIVTDPGVGVYIDGIYLGRQVGQNWSLSNIERLEVLRGPQGTLFGRNTVGGAINIITRQPGDEEIARVSLTAGSRGRFNGDAYFNTAITDDFAVLATASIKRRDGIGEFLLQPNPEARVGELFDISGRIAAKWQPTEKLSMVLAADGNDAKNGQNPFETIIIEREGLLAFDGGITNADQSDDPYDSNSGQTDLAQTTNSAYGINLTVNYEFLENLSGKFIVSHRYSEYEGGLDDDGAFVDFYSYPEVGNAKQTSIEAQVTGDYWLLDYVGGLYYFTEEGKNVQFPVTFASFPGGFFEQSQETDSFAIYGNVGINVTDDLRVAGGLRYTWDDKTAFTDLGFRTPGTVSADWQELTWEANVTYAIDQYFDVDALNVYAAISRGYQSGGFPARPYAVAFEPFDPVFATNYEAGVKGVPIDWLQMAFTVFYTDYTDLPVQVSGVDSEGFTTLTETADSRAWGFEWESTARVYDNLDIRTALGYLNSEFTAVDGESSIKVGNTPALSPAVTLTVGAVYTYDVDWGGEFGISGDVSYRSKMEGQPDNSNTTEIEGRALLNMEATYFSEDGTWTAGVYGKNIADERYTNASLNVGDYILNILSNDASEYGVRFSKTF